MKMRSAMTIAAVLLVTACGGNGSTDETDPDETPSAVGTEQSEDDSGGGEVANQQPPGQAVVLMQGETYTLDTVGPVGCNIEGSSFDFSFLLGDNEVNLVGGGDASTSTFNFNLGIQADGGITQYSADALRGDTGTLAVDGSSISYVGSMSELVEGGERESVGEVTISATCN